MTTDDLTDLELAAEAATPGPWGYSTGCGAMVCAGIVKIDEPGHTALTKGAFHLFEIEADAYYRDSDDDDEYDAEERREGQAQADARFIALANPARIAAIVSELRGLRASRLGSVASVLGAIQELTDQYHDNCAHGRPSRAEAVMLAVHNMHEPRSPDAVVALTKESP